MLESRDEHTHETDGAEVVDASKLPLKLVDGNAEIIGTLQTSVGTLYPNAKTLVLASSTADSTKTFSITVDDDGELTATEIIADGGEA